MKSVRSWSENDKKRYFLLLKKTFPQSVLLDTENAVLTNLSKVLRQKTEIISLNVLKKQFIFDKKSRFKMFLWTQRMQFWQISHEKFDKKPKIFLSLSQNDKKLIFSEFLGIFLQDLNARLKQITQFW